MNSNVIVYGNKQTKTKMKLPHQILGELLHPLPWQVKLIFALVIMGIITLLIYLT